MKRVNVPIDEELHKQLKVSVAENSTTIGQYVIEALTEKMERDKKKKGK